MKYAVLVTKRSGSTSGIRAAFRDHCGYAYMLKRLYGRFKVISVIITPRTFKLRTGKAFKLYDKHVDCSIVGTLDHVLNGLEMLDLNTLKRQQ
jgi:hypothetical protein